MQSDDLNTRYAAFDRACELEPDREPAAWMPDAAVTPDSLPPGVRMVDIVRLEAMHGTVITNEMLYRALHGETDCDAAERHRMNQYSERHRTDALLCNYDPDCFDADPDPAPVPNRVYSILGLLIVAALVVAAVMGIN